jgi:type IV secretion system protein VirD4
MSPSVGLPSEPRRRNRSLRFALWLGAYAASLLVGVNVALTQYLAHAFDYHEVLGTPWLGRVYAPWSWLAWKQDYLESNRGTFALAFAAIGLTALTLFLAGAYAILLVTRRSKAVSHLHGSAHWASPDEIERSGLLPRGDQPGAGVYVGAWAAPDGALRYLRHNGPEHVLAFAPTRAGKGVGLIIPTLLSWPESVVVYDLKGENWALSAGWRRSAGHVVCKFDPLCGDGTSVKLNPLAEVRLATPHEVADVQNIVTMIVDPDGKGLADHWDKTSYMFLTGVVLHALHLARAQGRVASLPEVAALLSNPEGVDALYAAMMENRFVDGQPHPIVARAAIDMLEKDQRERASVLSSAKTFFALYADPIVASNISRSDLRFGELMNREQPVSLYLVIDPQNKDRLRPLVRLLVTQLLRSLTPRLQFAAGSPVKAYRHRLLLLLDEFPALGRLPILQDALAYVAGYGIKAYLIAQDLTQLTEAYGRSEAISSNCHVKVAFAPNRIETAELISKMTGTATVVKRVVGTSGKRFGLALNQVNESIQEFARPLLTPDECMRLPGPVKNASTGLIEAAGDLLVFVAGLAPIYGRQILFFQDPVFAARARVAAPAVGGPVSNPTPPR